MNPEIPFPFTEITKPTKKESEMCASLCQGSLIQPCFNFGCASFLHLRREGVTIRITKTSRIRIACKCVARVGVGDWLCA